VESYARSGTALLIGSVRLNRQIETLKKTKPFIAVDNPAISPYSLYI
jgi:hypothetical protein